MIFKTSTKILALVLFRHFCGSGSVRIPKVIPQETSFPRRACPRPDRGRESSKIKQLSFRDSPVKPGNDQGTEYLRGFLQTANPRQLMLLMLCLLLPFTAYALSLEEALVNLYPNLWGLLRVAFAVAYLIGIWFIISGIHKLRAFGQVRTMMPSHAEFTGPMLQFFVGVLLLFLPTTIKVTVGTFWGEDSLLAYMGDRSAYTQAIESLMLLIRFLGLIAVIRGMVVLAKAGQKGQPPGTLGKGVVRLIGGFFALNIVGTIRVLQATFGLPDFMSGG